MTALSAYVDGIAVLGPGLPDWPATRAILAAEKCYTPAATILPAVAVLPPAERRRTGRAVRLAIAVGLEASAHAGIDPRSLPTVFASSGGDGENCHEICAALASSERSISPTRFHNAVHNAPAGYWSIATHAIASSTVLCAYDGSFAAGLLEAAAQVAIYRLPVLLIAYDTGYPSPLREKRPILDAFGVALVLAAERQERSIAQLQASLSDRPADRVADHEMEILRTGVPAARALPLLERIARRDSGTANLEYVGATTLRLDLLVCC